MKPFIILLATLICFTACERKEVNKDTGKPPKFNFGAIPDKPEAIRRVPVLMSARYYTARFGRPPAKDTDGDGISDKLDKCRTQKENYNGFEDTDGCPDTPPITPVPPDTTKPPVDTPIIVPMPSFPPVYTVKGLPPVIQQGSEGSCVSQGIVYVEASTVQTNKRGTSVILSPEYTYNQLAHAESQFQCNGTTVIGTYALMINQGSVLFSTMPYSFSNGCLPFTPTAAQLAEAANYKFSRYYRVPYADSVAVKTLLNQNHPVNIFINVDYCFQFGRPFDYAAGVGHQNYYSTDQPQYGYIPNFVLTELSPEFYGPHVCAVVGYDDTKGAYLIQNSYGSLWGDKGFRWISYSLMHSGKYVYNFEVGAVN